MNHFAWETPPDPVMRLTIGVDPGLKGAVVVLGDGLPLDYFDMPTTPRQRTKKGESRGNEVDGRTLAASLRGVMQKHPGAHVFAALEAIAMRPGNARGSDQKVGEGFGIVKGVLGALGISWCEVYAQEWKAHFFLLKKPKDASRIFAMRLFINHAVWFRRAMDDGRAEASLIARWAWEREKHAEIET